MKLPYEAPVSGQQYTLTRRDFMDGVTVTALAVGAASLGLDLADQQPPEPPRVRLAFDLEGAGGGSARLTVIKPERKEAA